ncbi:TetR/AcrR family transcriptional regulator [Massilia niastensis]|uniref:TetR/AcrR family transcriptional regulator n=1 Tax=Massilia niastensis TaxID=544911 RepID=UPI000A05CAB6|nr:TetR/AcrR family transcriptional regulator [Massilia niastensis]
MQGMARFTPNEHCLHRTMCSAYLKMKKIMTDPAPGNHRTRVAAERRERTRMRLLESALVVLGEKGPDAPVIDDVINHAGMSRGSFYNYFKTYEELLAAVAVQVGNDLVRLVDPVICSHDDPVLRLALALRLLLHAMQRSPVLAAFVARLGWPHENTLPEGIGSVSRDILEGMQTGVLTVKSFRVALDVFLGTFFGAANTLIREKVPSSYPEEISECILNALSAEPDKMIQAMQVPMPKLSFDGTSILGKLGTAM